MIEKTFEILKAEGYEQEEAMKLIFECPRLLSVNLDNRIQTIQKSFLIYH